MIPGEILIEAYKCITSETFCGNKDFEYKPEDKKQILELNQKYTM